MRPTNSPKIIFGGYTLPNFDEEGTIDAVFAALDKHKVVDIDTAYIYPGSEDVLKKHDASSKYVIHTKARGFSPGSLTEQSVLDSMAESLSRLGVDHVETFFLHSPDPDTPIRETLTAISELHKRGKFTHFGLSNFKASQVSEIYDIQQSNGHVLPTVFQGNYNAVARHIEHDLFPVLRKLGIAFYAYSPIAGGFLVKTSQGLKENAYGGRWQKAENGSFGQIAAMYHGMYGKDSLLAALDEWGDIAEEEGVSRAALAYRWITFHSALKEGDGVILGATKVSQVEETLDAIDEGPLSERAVERINAIWKSVEQDAPLDNYHR